MQRLQLMERLWSASDLGVMLSTAVRSRRGNLMDREPVEPKKEMDFEKSILKSKELYELIDQEVHREHNLISNRMTWYVTSQSFLMAAFAVSGSSNHKFEWLSKPFLPVLGILTSLITFGSLLAALTAMNQLKESKKDILKKCETLQEINPFKERFMEDKHLWIHVLGMTPPVSIPIIFLTAWIIALVQVYK
jgi:hypothetical protein